MYAYVFTKHCKLTILQLKKEEPQTIHKRMCFNKTLLIKTDQWAGYGQKPAICQLLLMATHSSILAWRIPRDRGTWWAMVHRVTKSWTEATKQAHLPGERIFDLLLFLSILLMFFGFGFLATLFQRVGSQFSDQGSNPCPLPWEYGVLTIGPPGKSLDGFYYITISVILKI